MALVPVHNHPAGFCSKARPCTDCNGTGKADEAACPTCRLTNTDLSGTGLRAGCAAGEGQLPAGQRCAGCPNA